MICTLARPRAACIALAAVLQAVAGLGRARAAEPAPELAITFDDLPAHSLLPPGETRIGVADKVIAALKAAGAPPIYGFVNGVQTVNEPASTPVLPAWRAAGNLLGNHTWSHMNLSTNAAEAFEADVVKNEPLLREAAGDTDWHWLRFPYLAEGDAPAKRAAVRGFLAQRGYKIAGVTMSFSDYAFNEPYARCMAKGDTAAVAALEQVYLKAAAAEAARARAMAHTLYGHDIPYVLLMHIGAFDARMLPRLLDQYRAEGFTLVSLPRAESDPFYRLDLAPAASDGPDTLEGVMWSRGLTPPPGIVRTEQLDAACRG